MGVPFRKRNCWDYWKCGRELGGANAGAEGICSAALAADSDGINEGRNGGRMCWGIAGTFGRDTPECRVAQRIGSCLHCEFYFRVIEEQGAGFRMASNHPRSGIANGEARKA